MKLPTWNKIYIDNNIPWNKNKMEKMKLWLENLQTNCTEIEIAHDRKIILRKISHVISHVKNMWNWNIFICNYFLFFSHVKYLIYMWHKLVQNFTCEILVNKTCIWYMKKTIHMRKLISRMKFLFYMWNWNIFTYLWFYLLKVTVAHW